MPGEQRCFKCGSILEGQAGVLDIHPPRMASWKRPWRRVFRLLRAHGKFATDGQSTARRGKGAEYAREVWILIPIIIPGLGHLLTGRFRQILRFLGLWCFLVALGAFIFHTTWGWICMGMAAAIHAWLAVDASLLDRLDNVMERMAAVLIAFVVVMLSYIGVSQVLGISFETSPLTIPAINMQAGDLLLMRPLEDRAETLIRGTIVGFSARSIGRGGTVTAVGQIVGLPNEVVVIDQGVYSINGTALPKDDYPVPRWFPQQRIELKAGPTQYFVSSEYSRVRGVRGVGSDIIKRLCLVDKEAIESQATMLWWPLTRRHGLNAPD